MPSDSDWYYLARERCRALAVEMVRMDAVADRFEYAGQQDRAGAVRWDRNLLREERSKLMREVWARRRIVVPR